MKNPREATGGTEHSIEKRALVAQILNAEVDLNVTERFGWCGGAEIASADDRDRGAARLKVCQRDACLERRLRHEESCTQDSHEKRCWIGIHVRELKRLVVPYDAPRGCP